MKTTKFTFHSLSQQNPESTVVSDFFLRFNFLVKWRMKHSAHNLSYVFKTEEKNSDMYVWVTVKILNYMNVCVKVQNNDNHMQ